MSEAFFVTGNAYEHTSGEKHWSCYLIERGNTFIVVRSYGSNSRVGSQGVITRCESRSEAKNTRETFVRNKLKRNKSGKYEPNHSLNGTADSEADLIDHLDLMLPGTGFKSSPIVREIISAFHGDAAEFSDDTLAQKSKNEAEVERVRERIQAENYKEDEMWGMFS